MYKACHPQNYKDGLYMKKKIGGGGLISVEDAVNINVDSFIKQVCDIEALMNEIRRIESSKVKKRWRSNLKDKMLKSKALHSRYFAATKVKVEKSQKWLKRSGLKKETAGMIIAA